LFKVLILGTSYGQPDAVSIWDGPVKRSLGSPRAQGFRQTLISSTFRPAIPTPFFSESGLYLGDGQEMRVPEARIERVLEKIVKDL
jgi:hypothetical protein